jgi:hypothetical protein
MFGKQVMKRKSKAERIAEDAWDNLVSAVETAGDTARSVGRLTGDTAKSVGRHTGDTAKSVGRRTSETARSVGRRTSDVAIDLAEGTQDRVGSAAEEAWTRASNALDALSGRKPRKPWGWIALAVAGGIAVGWAVAATAPKAVSAALDKFNEDDSFTEDAGNPTPTGTTTRYETPAAAQTTGVMPAGPPQV